MERRTLIAGAGALALGAGLAAPAAASPPPVVKLDSYVCNVADHCTTDEIGALAAGTPLTLRIDHERRYDPGSVAVLHNGRRLGYLPRGVGQTVGAQLSAGLDVTAEIRRVRSTGRPGLDITLNTNFGRLYS